MEPQCFACYGYNLFVILLECVFLGVFEWFSVGSLQEME